jgi:phage gp36-like protein
MADFLLKADFITIISTTALDSLTDSNDAIIDKMVDEAKLELISYLGVRYNIVELMAGDSALLPTLQMYCKDIVLYHLYSRHAHKTIPDIRIKRYQKALQWLIDVQEQKCNPFEYLPGFGETKSIIKSGGNPKRENHQL